MTIPSGALWNWHLRGLTAPPEVHAALAEILARPVVPLATADPDWLPDGALLCDVWYTGGEFATRIDCYLAPAETVETAVVAALARRLGRCCLMPDDTLDAGRFLLAAPDGTLRPVHVDVEEGEDGPILSRPRPCTVSDLRAICRQSRWAPDSVVPGVAA